MSGARRILIVDDDADLRLSLQLALEGAGYAVEATAGAAEALGLLKQRAVDIVITDLLMPDTDGFEAIGKLRRDFPSTRIVAVSGGGRRGAQHYLTAARLVGADATLVKPFEVEALLEILRGL